MKFRVGDAVSVRTTEVWPRHTEGKVITIETDEEEEPYEVKNSAGQEPKTWWFSEDELELVSAARPKTARGASGGKPKKRKQSMTDKRTREGKRMDAEQRAHTPAENAKRAALARHKGSGLPAAPMKPAPPPAGPMATTALPAALPTAQLIDSKRSAELTDMFTPAQLASADRLRGERGQLLGPTSPAAAPVGASRRPACDDSEVVVAVRGGAPAAPAELGVCDLT